MSLQVTPDREIANRPENLSSQEHFGNWEVGIIVGKAKTGHLLTMGERSTRLAIAQYCTSNDPKDIANATITALQGLPCQSLTFPRNSEFANYKDIEEALATRAFFADPGAPWQRGIILNLNKMIRAFYPQNSHFKVFKDAQKLTLLISYINNTPRRIFGYSSSAQSAEKSLKASMSKLSQTTKEQIVSVDLDDLEPPIEV